MTHIDRRGRRVRSAEVWAAARDANLSGESAQDVGAVFDLGLSALRQRARREGWRRKDQPDVAPPDRLTRRPSRGRRVKGEERSAP